MAKENIEDLSTKILLRRKKIVIGLTIIFIVVMVVNLVFIGASLTNKDKDLEFTYFLPFFLFIAIMIPMLMGVKKINQELKKREDK